MFLKNFKFVLIIPCFAKFDKECQMLVLLGVRDEYSIN